MEYSLEISFPMGYPTVPPSVILDSTRANIYITHRSG